MSKYQEPGFLLAAADAVGIIVLAGYSITKFNAFDECQRTVDELSKSVNILNSNLVRIRDFVKVRTTNSEIENLKMRIEVLEQRIHEQNTTREPVVEIAEKEIDDVTAAFLAM